MAFPVRSVFSHNENGRELSPLLLLDYAAPYQFPPGDEKRGVGLVRFFSKIMQAGAS